MPPRWGEMTLAEILDSLYIFIIDTLQKAVYITALSGAKWGSFLSSFAL